MSKKKETAVSTATEVIEVELVESPAKELEYKDINELISLKKDYDYSLESITEESNNILNSFFEIGKELKNIQDKKLYLIDGYKNIYELALEKFNFKKTTCHNMINVFEKYKDEDGKYIDDKYENYSFSSLVELLPVSNEEITGENFNPNMTVKEIRISKAKIQMSEFYRKRIERLQEVEKMFENKVNEYNAEEPNEKLHIKITKYSYDLSNEEELKVNICYSIVGGLSWYYSSLSFPYYLKKITFESHDIMEIDDNRLIGLFVEKIKTYREYAIRKLNEDEEANQEKIKAKKEKERLSKLKYKRISLNNFSSNHREFYLLYKFIYDFLLKSLIDNIDEYDENDDFRSYKENNAYVLYIRKKKKEICKLIFAEGASGYYLAFDYSKKEYENSDKLLLSSNVHIQRLIDKESMLSLISDQYSYLLTLLKENNDSKGCEEND